MHLARMLPDNPQVTFRLTTGLSELRLPSKCFVARMTMRKAVNRLDFPGGQSPRCIARQATTQQKAPKPHSAEFRGRAVRPTTEHREDYLSEAAV